MQARAYGFTKLKCWLLQGAVVCSWHVATLYVAPRVREPR